MRNRYTYADAGVDIDKGARLVDAIRPLARATRRPGADTGLAGFAGFFDPKAAGFSDPILLSATDGVGTKLQLAIQSGRHDTVGIDLVAMCVNDLVVHGAEPLFFLDYFATGKLQEDVAASVIGGIAEGCRLAGCALIGGETAEMPGAYPPGEYDLAGFAVGAVERDQVLLGDAVGVGDLVIGLSSSGAHSNGYSLIRRLLADHALTVEKAAPFAPERPLGEALLTPTRIYVQACLAGTKNGQAKAYAHITGGGFIDNIPRILPAGCGVDIDLGAWAPPALFGWLKQLGGMHDDEMLRTFNCGIGMIAIADRTDAEALLATFKGAGEQAQIIGAITDQAGVRFHGEAAW